MYLSLTKPKHADLLSMFPARRQGFSQVVLWLCFIYMHCFTTSIVKDSLLSTRLRPVLPVCITFCVCELHHIFKTFCEWNCLPSALPNRELVSEGVGYEHTYSSFSSNYLPSPIKKDKFFRVPLVGFHWFWAASPAQYLYTKIRAISPPGLCGASQNTIFCHVVATSNSWSDSLN